MVKRERFGSSFGVLVALTGSAIGLGNLWRFPYIVGNNGGAAFIIIYLFFVLLISLPIMFSEFIIGRRAQTNVFSSFKKLAPESNWKHSGILALLAGICIISFYSVVGGWTIDYLFKALSFQFSTTSEMELKNIFGEFVSSPIKPLIYTVIFLLLTAIIVSAGIKKGIEKYSKLLMPILFVIVIIIAIRSITLPGAYAGVEFLFKPDFSKVTSDTFLAALGQAFFSLSIGCGTIITYASYVSKKENIMKISFLTAMADTIFAIIAGLAIMPAVFAFGVSPSEGPGLVFITLPMIFAQIPLGGFLAIAFFFVLFVAAITSSISIFEVIISYLSEEFKLSRKAAVAIGFILILSLGVVCSLSQGLLSNFKIFGYNFFDLMDASSANILMPLGGLLAALFVGWKMKRSDVVDELSNGGRLKIKRTIFLIILFGMRFVSPIAIIIIMLDALL